ncbi:MAG: 30S ribosomal protein S17 [Planctomycetota bacterium]|nr:30S ribosomal protein S17 [Planctomycetota bacterium]MCX8040830.1 30S ribosomal protein S17 [Planctomycetota bacterium]MDW8372281.1 30S ribosomal protein S17 [Planctomycetota bacterium]
MSEVAKAEPPSQPSASAPRGPRPRGLHKRVIGVVTSDKMNKTRTVSVTEQYRHPKYGKYIKRTLKFHVHDERNESKEGDTVLIIECRPLSATKRWRLMKVLERAV